MERIVLKLKALRWIGRWVMGVAIIHTVFTFVLFQAQIEALLNHRLYDSVTTPMIGAATWFFLFGPPLFLIGLLIDWAEKNTHAPLPRALTWGLSIITILGIVMMPESGFYLMIPALIGLFHKQKSDEVTYRWEHPTRAA